MKNRMNMERPALARRARLGRLVTLAAVSTLIAVPAIGQRIERAGGGDKGAQGPPIVAVHATVEDMATKKEIGIVEPGGHFEVRSGQQVRLRLVAEAAGDRRRYPSTRFDVNQRSRHIQVDKVNPEVGAVIVTGGAPNERGGAVPVQYEILEGLKMDDRLRTGRFYLDIIPASAPVVDPQPQPTPELGATLYEHAGFRGRSERFLVNDRSFRDNLLPNDAASSVRVDRGCTLTLYRDENFGGGYEVFQEDAYNLEGTGVGNDGASSLRIECSTENRRGVTLFADSEFRGTSEFFYGEVPNLRDSRLGNDRASSIQIDRNCEVTLFADADFRGRSHTFRDSLPFLNGTNVGNDAVSSLRVSCW